MPDRHFEHPRLTAIYDALDPGRSDLWPYVGIAAEIGAHRVLDVGCGTGVLALRLAARGFDVTGIDPALGSLRIARHKPGADRVCWIHGDGGRIPPLAFDLVTMTGNTAQAIVQPSEWASTVRAIHDAMTPSGHFVFESRTPAYRGWLEWNPSISRKATSIPRVGVVVTWIEVTDVSWPLVSFRSTFQFESDGTILTSDSTLRFREREEIESNLSEGGLSVTEVRDAPDRPGREFVFLARRAVG